MSALAVYLEEEGIATSIIGLIRMHLEKIQPPRALWVPFQLGRPLGQPNNAQFQKKVLRAALRLLDEKPKNDKVILQDFPDSEPGIEGDAEWSEPKLDSTSLDIEIDQLKDLHKAVRQRFARTSVGLSGLTVTEISAYLLRFFSSQPVQNPSTSLSDLALLRFAVDDLKAFYLEAGCAGAGWPSSEQLADWFWNKTAAARLIRDLRENCLATDDRKYQLIGDGLVPRAWL